MPYLDRNNQPKPYGDLDLNDSGRRLMVYYPWKAGKKEVGPPPTPSPTPLPPTPTTTPTPTPTPSAAPACDFTYNIIYEASIAPTGTTKYSLLSLSGSTNLSNPTYVWSLQDFYDISGNTVSSYTGQTTPVGEFRATGTSLVSLVVTGDEDTITASTFNVSAPTTYTMFFGSHNTTTMSRTTDLVNYSSSTLPQAINPGVKTNVVYSPVLDNYVAGDSNGAFVSNDGINWSATTVPVGVRFSNIIWVPKLQAYASIGDRGNYSLLSTDGVNWSAYGTFAWGDLGAGPFVWDDVNEYFIMVDGNGDIWTSQDNQSWSLTLTNTAGRWTALQTYNGRTTLVETDSGTVFYSDDALNWSSGGFTGTTGNSWGSTVLPNGRRVVAGDATGGFCYSDDGINYTGVSSPSGWVANAIGMLYNEVEDKVILANKDNSIFISTDGGQTYTQNTGLPFSDGRNNGIRYNT